MAWERLTIRIRCLRTDGEYEVGTGFPIQRGLILTARHVVKFTAAKYIDGKPQIEIRWWHCRDPEFAETNKTEGYIPAELFWCSDDETVDAALLKAAHPAAYGTIPLMLDDPEQLGECTMEGFPSGARQADQAKEIRVAGITHSLHGSGRHFQIDVSADPHKSEAWGGLSGAAVIHAKTGHAIGLITHAKNALDSNKFLTATPIRRVYECTGFSTITGETWREIELENKYIADFRTRISERLDAALQGFDTASLKEIAHGLSLENPEAVSRDQIKGLLLGDDLSLPTAQTELGRAIGAFQRLYSKNEEKQKQSQADAYANLVWLLELYRMGDDLHRLVTHLKHTRNCPNSLPIGSPAYTLIRVELLAAAIDGRIPNFMPRRAKTDQPRGSKALSFITPETGPEKDKSLDLFIKHVGKLTGLDIVPAPASIAKIEAFLKPERIRLF